MQYYSKLHPELGKELKEFQELNVAGWLKKANARTNGNFLVVTPAGKSKAEAMILPLKRSHSLCISIQDENEDGTPDSLFLIDSKFHNISVSIKNGDGVFDSWTYGTSPFEKNSISYTDNNMDGQPDFRMSAEPNASPEVFIGGNWRNLILKDKNRYIEIDGILKPVKSVDGVWKLSEEK
jgi:hypothetical protein